jgi:hypothetical protein
MLGCIDPTTGLTVLVLIVLMLVLLMMLYSPSQYRELSRLYHEQIAADDTVYEGINSGRFKRVWFKITTKNNSHYYG